MYTYRERERETWAFPGKSNFLKSGNGNPINVPSYLLRFWRHLSSCIHLI